MKGGWGFKPSDNIHIGIKLLNKPQLQGVTHTGRAQTPTHHTCPSKHRSISSHPLKRFNNSNESCLNPRGFTPVIPTNQIRTRTRTRSTMFR